MHKGNEEYKQSLNSQPDHNTKEWNEWILERVGGDGTMLTDGTYWLLVRNIKYYAPTTPHYTIFSLLPGCVTIADVIGTPCILPAFLEFRVMLNMELGTIDKKVAPGYAHYLLGECYSYTNTMHYRSIERFHIHLVGDPAHYYTNIVSW